FQVNTYTSRDQYHASICSSSGGSVVIVWDSYSDQDGDNDGVFAQRFDSAGSPAGSEFQVNTYTTNYQGYRGLDVACDSTGEFVVVWNSATQDGGSDGIF